MTADSSHPDLEAACAALAERRPEAVSLVRRQMALAPGSFEAWHALGLAHLERDETPEAIRALIRAGVLFSGAYYIPHNLGLALLREGHEMQALGCFVRSVQLEPNNVSGLLQIAQLLYNARLPMAGSWTVDRCLSAVAAIAPTEAGGHRMRAHFARARGALEIAELSLRRVLAVQAVDAVVGQELVEVLRLSGKPGAALDVLRSIDRQQGVSAAELNAWRGWLQAAGTGRLSLDGRIEISVALSDQVLKYRHAGSCPRPRLFIGYIRDALPLPPDDPWFDGHANRWEAAEINRLLLRMGFDLDVANSGGEPQGAYAGYLSSEGAPWRTSPGASAVKLRLATGSSPDYQNRRERERVRAVTERTGMPYRLYRQIPDEADELAALAEADAIALTGNDHTLSTYAPALRSKTTLIAVSAPPATSRVAKAGGPGAGPRHFLWYGGAGAILKGLDLVLEAFARQDRFILEIVGAAAAESDLRRAYGRLLAGHPRILVHGQLPPGSPAFAAVLDRCFAFVSPSASEGMSGSVVACLQAGLYPIISRDCGVDLPSGCGRLLDEPTIETLSRAIADVGAMPEGIFREQADAIQRWARDRFSRERFFGDMERFLRDKLGHLASPA